jgi:hypothetical protein
MTHERSDYPFTLTKCRNGAGALQFSTALYQRGRNPGATATALLDMVREFGAGQGFREPADEVIEEKEIALAGVSYRMQQNMEEIFVRVWYVSDGKSFAKITYFCEWGEEAEELQECESIVRTIRFKKK